MLSFIGPPCRLNSFWVWWRHSVRMASVSDMTQVLASVSDMTHVLGPSCWMHKTRFTHFLVTEQSHLNRYIIAGISFTCPQHLLLLLRYEVYKYGLSSCGVCLFVMFVHCVETNKHIIKFFYYRVAKLFYFFPTKRHGTNARGYEKMTVFNQYLAISVKWCKIQP